MTPIHFASHNGHLNIIELLIQNGSDIHFKDSAIVFKIMGFIQFTLPQTIISLWLLVFSFK